MSYEATVGKERLAEGRREACPLSAVAAKLRGLQFRATISYV
jgi:hypothetical protein